MKFFVIIFLILFCFFQLNTAKAQAVQKETIYFVVNQMPEYQGGELELSKQIVLNFKWPHSCSEHSGRFYVRLAVMPNGTVDSGNEFY